MKKPHDFKAVSNYYFCVHCFKPLKLNLVERKTKSVTMLCFKHYIEQKRKQQ